MKHKLFIAKVAFLFLWVLVFVYSSCKKENSYTLSAAKSLVLDINQLKSIYSKETSTLKSSSVKTMDIQSSMSLIKNFDVSWDSYKVYQRESSQVIQFNLHSDSILFTMHPLTKGESVNIRNSSSVVFIEYDNGQRLSFFMKVIEEVKEGSKLVVDSVHYGHIPTGFTGMVMYYTLSNQFINGYRYTNGKIDAKLKNLLSSKPASQQTLSTNKELTDDTGCGYQAVYGYSIHYWWFYSDYTGWILNTEQEYGFLGWAPAECLQAPDPNSGGPTGGVNGDGGGGPTTPIVPPIPVVKTDSLSKHFPCATLLVINALLQNPVYSDWVQPFSSDRKPDLTWQDGQLSWNLVLPGDTKHTYKLGETSYDGRSATITLNTNMLQQSSQLLIAAAAIHETLHAYINYSIETNIYFTPPPAYSRAQSWLTSLDYWIAENGLPSNYRDHYEMLTDYFDKAVSILKTWDKGAHTDAEYRMSMLYGLDTNDLLALPANNPSSLSVEYSNILAKYGITAQMLDTYWNTQLINSTSNLPIGCSAN